MKKTIKRLIIILTAIALFGCDKDNKNKTKEENTIKTNCEITECINLIDLDSTVEEIDKIIGITGKKNNKNSNEYKWKFSSDENINVKYENGEKAEITINVPYTKLKNKKIDLKNYKDLTQNINSKEGVTYNYFKEKVGNIDGILLSKSTFISKYIWVDEKDSYLIATFSNGTNKCKKISGVIKNSK